MNETIEVINSLRTIHGNFSDRIIDKKDIDTIIDCTLKTANASARQSYSIIVVDDKEKMHKLFGYKGSHAFIFSVDYTRLNETAPKVGCEFDNTNIYGFITGATDTLLAAQTAVIAAKALGIDTLITNGIHRVNLNDLYTMLKLPETSCFPLVAIVFGYAKPEADKEEHKKGRLSKEFLVSYNEYHHLTDDEIESTIAEYDDKEKNIGLNSSWEKLGYQHYLQWFYNSWTGKPAKVKKAEGKLKEFQDRIVKSGFWFE